MDGDSVEFREFADARERMVISDTEPCVGWTAVATALDEAAQAADGLNHRSGDREGAGEIPAFIAPELHHEQSGAAAEEPAEIAEGPGELRGGFEPLAPETGAEQAAEGHGDDRRRKLRPEERAHEPQAQQGGARHVGAVIDDAHGADAPVVPGVRDALGGAAQPRPDGVAVGGGLIREQARDDVEERMHSGRHATGGDERGDDAAGPPAEAVAPDVRGHERPEDMK